MKRKLLKVVLATAVICTLGVGSSYALDVNVTGVSGGVGKSNNPNGPWDPVSEGDVLSTCTYIILPGNYTWIRWQRVGGCGNKGEAGTGLSRTKILHVGTEITDGPEAVFPFGAIDLVLVGAEGGESESDATIHEEENCYGTGHCGFNTTLAQAAPLDPTPPGEITSFYGRALQSGTGEMQVTFYNLPSSPIPIGTTPLLGPYVGQILPVSPGQSITYYADGSFVYSSGIPTVGEWGLIILGVALAGAGTLVLRRRLARRPVAA